MSLARVLALSALALVVLSPGAGGAPAQAPSPSIAFYNANAVANGMTAGFNIVGFLPLPQLLSLSSVTAQSRISIGISTSLAVLPNPGDLVLSLPGTLAGLAGISGLPNYPAAARSDYPVTPDAQVDLVPDAGLGAGRLAAHSGEETSTATAFISGLNAPVGLVPFSVGGVRSDSETTRTSDTTFKITARSTATDVSILGGVLHIGSVTSEAAVLVRDGVPTPLPATTTVSGASVAGQPVGITDQGITAQGSSAPVAPIVDSAAASLQAAGMKVRTTPATTEQRDGHASSSSGQLSIEMTTVVNNLPTVVTLSFGDALASLDIGAAPTTALPALTPTTSATGVLPGTGTPSVNTGSALVDRALPSAPPGVSAPTRTTTSTTNPIVSVLDFQPMYRALAGAGLALLLAHWLVRKVLHDRPAGRSDVRALWRW